MNKIIGLGLILLTGLFATGVVSGTIDSSKVIISAPFVSQAPFGDWKNPDQQNGCEEASILIAMSWVQGIGLINLKYAEKTMSDLSKYSQKRFGTSKDTSVVDTAILMKEFFKYNAVTTKENVSVSDIKNILKNGSLIIAPVNGQKLKNKYYSGAGPEKHMLVIIGYDNKKQEFITNDVGTKRGQGYRYKYNVFMNALYNYPTSVPNPKIKNLSSKNAIMVVSKE